MIKIVNDKEVEVGLGDTLEVVSTETNKIITLTYESFWKLILDITDKEKYIFELRRYTDRNKCSGKIINEGVTTELCKKYNELENGDKQDIYHFYLQRVYDGIISTSELEGEFDIVGGGVMSLEMYLFKYALQSYKTVQYYKQQYLEYLKKYDMENNSNYEPFYKQSKI